MRQHKDKDIEVDWVATGGHTVPDLLKRVDKDVIAKKPTIVVIQIGCNDARRISAGDVQDEPGGADRPAAEGEDPGRPVHAHQRRREARRHQQGRREARRVRRRSQREVAKAKNVPAQRSAQGVRRALEEEQPRQQGERHPDLRRQPLQRRRPPIRRRADAQEVQVTADQQRRAYLGDDMRRSCRRSMLPLLAVLLAACRSAAGAGAARRPGRRPKSAFRRSRFRRAFRPRSSPAIRSSSIRPSSRSGPASGNAVRRHRLHDRPGRPRSSAATRFASSKTPTATATRTRRRSSPTASIRFRAWRITTAPST